MSLSTMAAVGASVANALLLSVVLGVWVRNYRRFRTPLLLGLVGFGATLLVENGVAVYFLFSMRSLYVDAPAVQRVVIGMRALQTVALLLLTYVTLR